MSVAVSEGASSSSAIVAIVTPNWDSDGIRHHTGSWRDAVRGDWRELRTAPWPVRSDREAVLGAVEQDEKALADATDDLRSDRGFVIEAVRIRGEALRHVAEGLRADRGVVMEAIAQDRLALRHASAELRADPSLVAEAMRLRPRGHTLECAAKELAVPPDVIREASHLLDPAGWRAKVSRDWQKLATAPAEVRDDQAVVLQAVKDSWGDALRYASDARKGDKELVLEAVRLRGDTLQFASVGVQGDKDVVRAAVEQAWESLQYASEDCRGDRALATAAVAQASEALQFVAPTLLADREFILKAVLANGTALRFATGELQKDRVIALAAFKQNSLALRWVPEDLRQSIWDETREPEMGQRRTPTHWVDVQSKHAGVALAQASAGPAVADEAFEPVLDSQPEGAAEEEGAVPEN